MNQGISQGLSMLLYAIAASALFTVAIALFGGGYYQYTTVKDTDEGTQVLVDHSQTLEGIPEEDRGTAKRVNSLWDQYGSTMKR